LITRIIFGGKYRSVSYSLCSFLHSPVTLSFVGPNIILNTLFSSTLGLRSSLNLSDQVSNPCKTTDRIIVLYSIIFKFLGRKLEGRRVCTEWWQALNCCTFARLIVVENGQTVNSKALFVMCPD
jgi:hypothetical protein